MLRMQNILFVTLMFGGKFVIGTATNIKFALLRTDVCKYIRDHVL